MSNDWDFYFSNVNGSKASLFVNLGIRSSAPDPKYPHLLWTWVHFLTPRPDGLSSDKEAPTLHSIEDAIVSVVQNNLDAQYVGRITTLGRREFYWYAPTTKNFSRIVQQAMLAFQPYKFDTGHKVDKAWSQYLDLLYPLPEQIQSIQNRKVIEALQERGDNLQKPRPVQHWVYFKSDAPQEQFRQATEKLGYRTIRAFQRDDGQSDQPFGLVIERVDKADWQSIDAAVIELFQLARKTGGEYDGWETAVER